MKLFEMGIKELHGRLKKKEAGYRETVFAYIKQIEEKNKEINPYISFCFEKALSKAGELEKRTSSNKPGSILAGIPFAVKDNMCVKDTMTTCASKMLSNFSSPYTATAVQKLLDKDALLLGKLNMDEFAMGGSNETSYFGCVRNPKDHKRVPGGSSGGSAAAVAGNMACFALGSDTGGSIRQPASYCGVVGLKPTYGKVSRYGLVAFASSLDQIGPLTRDIEDSALVLSAISGQDIHDSTSCDIKAPDHAASLNSDIKGMNIAYPKEYLGSGIDPVVKDSILKAIDVLKEAGVRIEEISLPLTEYAIPAYYIISSAEASSNLSRYDGIKYGHRPDAFDDILDLYVKSRTEGFGDEVKRRIMLGTYALSSGYYDAYYLKAIKVRNMIRSDFGDIFSRYDAIIGPVAPTTAYHIGEKINDPLKMYLGDIYTVSANIAGIPALSVPAGEDDQGMPIGMQIMGDSFSEQKILDIAYAYEKITKAKVEQ